MLGFFTNSSEDKRFITKLDLDPAILAKLAVPGMKTTTQQVYVLACRNGRVLLDSCSGISVWDPVRHIEIDIDNTQSIFSRISIAMPQFVVQETMMDFVHIGVTQPNFVLFGYRWDTLTKLW